MKRLLPVALLFAALAILVGIREVRRGSFESGGPPEGEFLPLAATQFEPKVAAKIEVTAPGGTEPLYVLEREGETWAMTRPFRAPAHQNHVNDLCDLLSDSDVEPRADDAGTLRDLDLTSDRATTVKVTDAAGKVLAHVAVGRSAGRSGRGAFVRFLAQESDVRSYATTASIREALGLPQSYAGGGTPEAPKASHFRDCDFPSVKLDGAKRVEITIPGRHVAFTKSGDSWTAEGGPGFPVAKGAIDGILKKLGPDFHAKDLADPADSGRLGLADPKWILAVTLEDGTVRRVFGAADAAASKYHVRLDAAEAAGPVPVYEANAWDFQGIFPPGSTLFTIPAFDLANEKLTHAVVEKGGSRIAISRNGTKPSDEWKVDEPALPLAAKSTSLQSLASAVRNLRATDWIDGTDVTAELTVSLGTPDAMQTIRIGPKAPWGKDRLCVLPHAPGKVLVVADSSIDRIDVAPTTLFEPKVLHGWLEPDVKTVRVAGAASWSVERGEQGWTLVRGDERKDADAAAVHTWVEALLALETREAAPAAGDPEATLEIEKSDGSKRTLSLAPARDGKRTVGVGSLSFPTDRTDLLPAPETLVSKTAGPAPEKTDAPK